MTDESAASAGVRCFGDGDPLYSDYHDNEWGVQVHGDQQLFERVSLEAFQSGLSWITVLRKREAFRTAFHGFDPTAVARMDDAEVEKLLQNEGIIRNRAKIVATINNAKALIALQGSGRSLDELFWSYAPSSASTPQSFEEVPATTPGSKALAKELRSLGFKFVGPTTAYAAMQACGLVNDHIASCPTRSRQNNQSRSS